MHGGGVVDPSRGMVGSRLPSEGGDFGRYSASASSHYYGVGRASIARNVAKLRTNTGLNRSTLFPPPTRYLTLEIKSD